MTGRSVRHPFELITDTSPVKRLIRTIRPAEVPYRYGVGQTVHATTAARTAATTQTHRGRVRMLIVSMLFARGTRWAVEVACPPCRP